MFLTMIALVLPVTAGRLDGLVVKASGSGTEDPGFEPACDGILPD